MRKVFLVILSVLSLTASANDGVYFLSGSHLVPVQETDIAISKEVLTIGLCDDGFASVDVYYELMNHGQEKTVQMGFEAAAPYNDAEPFSPEGIHPHIKAFTVEMNGLPISYRNAVVAIGRDSETEFRPIDLSKWKINDDWMGNVLWDAETDSVQFYGYAYLFDATFKPGQNIVHHTYRYRMSYSVDACFSVPYWLKPAMRWANRQIDDFTLRIKAENTTKHFCLADSLFAGQPFRIVGGKGKMRQVHHEKWDNPDVTYTEIVLRNGIIEWHANDFKPVDNISIESADILMPWRNTASQPDLQVYYDANQSYTTLRFAPWLADDNAEDPTVAYQRRIMRNLPFAHRGYVFKDKQLKKFFEGQWWYMPDAKYKPAPDDLLPHEWKMIDGI